VSSRTLCLSFDLDWAPDFAIDRAAELCIKSGVKATWFVTHSSPAVDRLARHGELFELGIHPNFMTGSSHGRTYEEVIAYCRALVPNAVSVRTHGVYQSGPLLAQIMSQTGVRVDSSILLPEMPHIRAVRVPTGAGWLTRIPCFWADDYELSKDASRWTPADFAIAPGVQVYVFHPIHVFLNTASLQQYQAMRAATPELSKATPEQLERFANPRGDAGVRVMLSRLLDDIAREGGGVEIRDFAEVGRS